MVMSTNEDLTSVPGPGDPPKKVDSAREVLDEELAGLDALELAGKPLSFGRRLWSATWPKLAAIVMALLIWQLIVWSGWKPEYVLPGPGAVFSAFWSGLSDGTFTDGMATTLRRAFVGYAMALVIGIVLGALVSQVKFLRVAFGSLITGLQTMPSIAWFPLAILLFKLTESAIYFVVVLGAAPAIANGIISGADNVPPLLKRAGRVLGAGRVKLYFFVILPASMPAFISGMKQGWAFAWRSLLAGELLVIVARTTSIGVQLSYARELSDSPLLMAVMMLILIIGIVIDSLFFGTLERTIRRKWGLDA
jgi:NitT/TauT family transport system permease protein